MVQAMYHSEENPILSEPRHETDKTIAAPRRQELSVMGRKADGAVGCELGIQTTCDPVTQRQ